MKTKIWLEIQGSDYSPTLLFILLHLFPDFSNYLALSVQFSNQVNPGDFLENSIYLLGNFTMGLSSQDHLTSWLTLDSLFKK